MYSTYYNGWDVNPEFIKEFVCIFDGWLGIENSHKLDEVTEIEWSKFNYLIRAISKKYTLYLVNCENEKITPIQDVESIIQPYEVSMNKEGSEFTKLIIPELDCIFTEEWDYTYIIWHKNNNAVEKLSPLIKESGLFKFND